MLLKPFLQPGMYHIGMNAMALALGTAYLWITGPKRRAIPESAPVSNRQKALFMTGLCLCYLALGSPINLIGDELFSVHMFQQSLLYLIMPPLILLGIPDWLYRWGFDQVKGVWRGLFTLWSRPLLSLLVFNGLFSLYHVPRVFDTIMGSAFYHALSHGLLTLSAFLMWWPVTAPLPEQERLSPLRKMAYICAAGVLLTPACALIIFADHLLFTSYSGGERLFPILSPRDDQQMGGVIMKILQEAVYGVALAGVFFQWVRREKRNETYGIPTDHPSPSTTGEANWNPPSVNRPGEEKGG
ncbi:cytochrome c oxidase assembly protein [Paludifilum halophilum]|nr:cytochrome c oxidase assembly protein [Paludifilum halophilum]